MKIIQFSTSGPLPHLFLVIIQWKKRVGGKLTNQPIDQFSAYF
ncbi:hypothetical protein [Globicatella sanguinis]